MSQPADEKTRLARAEMVFPSSSEYLSLVRSNARWFCEKCRFPEKDASRIVLAVVEAVTNVIRHAYHGQPDQNITLRFSELPSALEIELLDRGEHVSPARHKERDLEEVKPGGLGVHMMKQCMDDVRYEERPGGGTRLVLKKLMADDPASEGSCHPGREG